MLEPRAALAHRQTVSCCLLLATEQVLSSYTVRLTPKIIRLKLSKNKVDIHTS